MLDLKPQHLKIILKILKQHASDCEVRAFGSRVTGKAKPFSDLDLVIISKENLDWRRIETIKEAFSESNLPMMIDVVDWHTLSPEFQQQILKTFYRLQ